MKDEEIAEEYYYKTYPVTLNIGEEERKKEVTDIFLAGLKAGRPQLHTPDVPTRPINKVVFGYVKYYNSKLPCLVGWNGEWWYDAGTCNKKVKLIAWCEIPTFDKEIE